MLDTSLWPTVTSVLDIAVTYSWDVIAIPRRVTCNLCRQEAADESRVLCTLSLLRVGENDLTRWLLTATIDERKTGRSAGVERKTAHESIGRCHWHAWSASHRQTSSPLPPHHHCPLLCPFPHSTTGSLLPSFLPASRTVLSAQTVAVFINSWPCRMDRCPEKQLIQKAYSKFVWLVEILKKKKRKKTNPSIPPTLPPTINQTPAGGGSGRMGEYWREDVVDREARRRWQGWKIWRERNSPRSGSSLSLKTSPIRFPPHSP